MMPSRIGEPVAPVPSLADVMIQSPVLVHRARIGMYETAVRIATLIRSQLIRRPELEIRADDFHFGAVSR